MDLSNIITTADGGKIDGHPFVTKVLAVKVALEVASKTSVDEPLRDLFDFIDEAKTKKDHHLAALAHASDATSVLVQCLTMYSSSSKDTFGSEGLVKELSTSSVVMVLKTLCFLVPLSRDIAAQFRSASGPQTAASILVRKQENDIIIASALNLATVSATRDEDGKSALMAVGIGTQTIAILDEACDFDSEVSAPIIANSCALIISLTSADDMSVPGSSAFANARALGKAGAVAALTKSLARNKHLPLPVLTTTCDALRQVVANEDLCQEAEERGVIRLAMGMLDDLLDNIKLQSEMHLGKMKSFDPDQAILLYFKSILALLRQLASSDAVKSAITSANGLVYIQRSIEGIVSASQFPTPALAAVQQQSFGFLANVTLRAPETGSQAVDLGVVDAVVLGMGWLCKQDTILNHVTDKRTILHASVASALRQGCMALRNIASRCPERREEMKASGVEEVIRHAVDRCPTNAQLKDAASAALRDLGLIDYKL